MFSHYTQFNDYTSFSETLIDSKWGELFSSLIALRIFFIKLFVFAFRFHFAWLVLQSRWILKKAYRNEIYAGLNDDLTNERKVDILMCARAFCYNVSISVENKWSAWRMLPFCCRCINNKFFRCLIWIDYRLKKLNLLSLQLPNLHTDSVAYHCQAYLITWMPIERIPMMLSCDDCLFSSGETFFPFLGEIFFLRWARVRQYRNWWNMNLRKKMFDNWFSLFRNFLQIKNTHRIKSETHKKQNDNATQFFGFVVWL